MSNIQILDCTLRDGGYVNEWNFGEQNIIEIIRDLTLANIDIVECGFLSDLVYNKSCTLYPNTEAIERMLPDNHKNTMFVAMIALGEKELDYAKISPCNKNSITGVRITFHKNEVDRAIVYANDLKKKGYHVFMQPIGTMTYQDDELVDLVKKMNELQPYAFYIVDTLGAMVDCDLKKMFNLIDEHLSHTIQIGFHSHNNLQLSFANAKELISFHEDRAIIIDSSVFGMGRGAGNLNTELITQHINGIDQDKYNLNGIFDIIDNHILRIKKEHEWGYCAPYYIAAVNGCHPNYAKFLMDKRKLTSNEINEILSSVLPEEKYVFNKQYISALYLNYHSELVDDSEDIVQLRNIFKGKEVLVLATGATLETHEERIKKIANKESVITISLNRNYTSYKQDYIFISNFKKYKKYKETCDTNGDKTIVTSNIEREKAENQYIINIKNYLSENNSEFSDDVGLILLKLLKNLEVDKIYLAGFDGIAYDKNNNYSKDDIVIMSHEDIINRNMFIKETIQKLVSDQKYEFVTPSLYEC